MWKGKKVAAYSATRNMYMFVPAAVKSLLTYSDVDEVWLLIEDDEFPKDFGRLPECVHIRNLSNQRYLRWDGPNMKCGWTYMAMMRAALCYEFPELDRILSIDMDCICCKDISDLWNVALGDEYYFAAADEIGTSEKYTKKLGKRYFYANMGVMVQNLKKLRDGTNDKVIKLLDTEYREFIEQDAYNEVCQGHILELDSCYNAQRYTKPCTEAKIIHFCGIPRWHDQPLFKQWNRIAWETVLDHRKKKWNK